MDVPLKKCYIFISSAVSERNKHNEHKKNVYKCLISLVGDAILFTGNR